MNANEFPNINLLLLEDNKSDVQLLLWAFQRCHFYPNLAVVRDGLEAMNFLHRTEGFSNTFTPDLVLLDLNVPKKTGHGVLKEMKQDPRLCQIPTLIFTSSNRVDDVQKSYELHADGYFVKPTDFKKLIVFAESLKETVENHWSDHKNERIRRLLREMSEPVPESKEMVDR